MNRTDFLAHARLTVDGKFELNLPSNVKPGGNSLIQIDHLNTALPFRGEYFRSLCSDECDKCEEADQENYVLRLDFDSNFLFSTAYNFEVYHKSLDREGYYNTEEMLKQMWISDEAVYGMFDDLKLSKIYEKVNDYDVLFLTEYGLSLNDTARLKLVRKEQDVTGMVSLKSMIYGFHYGFKYSGVSTLSENSSGWVKISDDVLRYYSDHHIGDMLRFLLDDFGGGELFNKPDVDVILSRREGYGFLLMFPEKGTFLSVTVVAGLFPYVLSDVDFPNNKLTLIDRDYDDLEVKQSVCELRSTNSKYHTTADYCVSVSLSRARDFDVDGGLNYKTRTYRLSRKKIKNSFLFDCPFAFQNLSQFEGRYVSMQLPIYGGFGIIYAIYMYYIFYKYFRNNEKVFVTPQGLMTFLSGVEVFYTVSHGMFPHEKVDGEYVDRKIYNLINPELRVFRRIMDLRIFREYDEGKQFIETMGGKVTAVVLMTDNSPAKMLLSDDDMKSARVVQTYFNLLEKYPEKSRNVFLHSVTYEDNFLKPIVIEKQFTFQPFVGETIQPAVVKFHFAGVHADGTIKRLRFFEGDYVIMKGSVVWR